MTRSTPDATLLRDLAPVVPTIVYDTYWKFAAERQEIFFRRMSAPFSLWTKDPILSHHKFTNAYRASDRVSQFLIKNVIYAGDQGARETFFRTILFKLFNRIDTWQLLEQELGELTYRRFRHDRYARVLEQAMCEGKRIYSAAYIMPAASKFEGKRKHETHLRLLDHMIRERAPERIEQAKTLREVFECLRSFPMLGDFLAYQFTTDLNYGRFIDFSEMEFVVPGPGARDGIRKCFLKTGGLSEADLIRLVTQRQRDDFRRLRLDFRSLWGRKLQLIDCQNLFCEVDKYARVAHPEVGGLSGRTRIKQTFDPNPSPIRYWYPPKWGLNELIAASPTGVSHEGHEGTAAS